MAAIAIDDCLASYSAIIVPDQENEAAYGGQKINLLICIDFIAWRDGRIHHRPRNNPGQHEPERGW